MKNVNRGWEYKAEQVEKLLEEVEWDIRICNVLPGQPLEVQRGVCQKINQLSAILEVI